MGHEDALDATQLVGRLEVGAVGDERARRHLPDVDRGHLQRVQREPHRHEQLLQRGDPAGVERRGGAGRLVLVDQVVDVDLLLVLAQHVVAVGQLRGVAEALPVLDHQRRALAVLEVPEVQRHLGVELERHRVAAEVEIGRAHV